MIGVRAVAVVLAAFVIWGMYQAVVGPRDDTPPPAVTDADPVKGVAPAAPAGEPGPETGFDEPVATVDLEESGPPAPALVSP